MIVETRIVFHSLASFYLFFFWQFREVQTLRSATPSMCFLALWTLYKQQVTRFILTVYMLITRLTTLMAICDYIIRNSLAQPLVKNEIFTNEFIFNCLVLFLLQDLAWSLTVEQR